jgi:4-alpha-glucanotransferase
LHGSKRKVENKVEIVNMTLGDNSDNSDDSADQSGHESDHNSGHAAHEDASEAALYALADVVGIITHWDNALGHPQTLKAEALQRVLTAMEIECGSMALAQASHARLCAEAAAPQSVPLITAELDQPVHVHWPQADAPLPYEIQLESGETRTGIAHPVGSNELALPGIDAWGYHSLRLGTLNLTVAVAPTHCYGVADALRDVTRSPDSRLWGLGVQLYALRHSAPSGSGDFSSLAQCCMAAAREGADAVAINPVHAGFSADASRYSPYAPSSRLFLNPLYVDPAAVFGQAAVSDAAATLGALERLEQLDNLAEIDWPELAPIRLAILRRLFEQREALLPPALLEEYRQFCMAGGNALYSHACFEALHRFHADSDAVAANWRDWPEDQRDPQASGVTEFAREHAHEVGFHLFAQWLAARGLDDAQRCAREAGMAIGLIADLAVGTDGSGSHAWSRQDEIFKGLQVGAPPDIYNPYGQAWGISAFSPRGLRQHGYRAFIEMLRATLGQAGGLRIDHALGLARLWLIPDGAGAADGAYLRFPFDDLMRLIALESWRARAIIIGENLGTVPAGFNEQLRQRGLLGISVLWFERTHGEGGREIFKQPREWSPASIATTTTHDLPSVAGWWSGRDIEWRAQLNLLEPGPAVVEAFRQREVDRQILWQALLEAGTATGECPAPDSIAPVEAALRFVGSTPAPLAIIPIEDLLASREQPNVPGTILGHPNWQRRLPGDIDAALGTREVAQRLAGLNAARRTPR